MTSSRSCFNKDQSLGRFKRTAWMPSMAVAVLFFAMPVATTILAQNIQRRIANNVLSQEQIVSQSIRLFEGIGLATAIIALMGGVIAALFTWNYLNSRRQVDFYHALPYRRATLFGSYWVAGMASFILPYLVMEVISVGVFSVTVGFGTAGGTLWPIILEEAGRTLLMFFVSFSVTSLAAMLCGNLFVSFCGTIVFFGLPALTWGLMIMLFTRCYDTFTEAALPTEAYLSYTTAVYDLFSGNGDPHYLYWLIVSALLTVLAGFIYARRPSEAAGRAMAFPFTQPIVKYPLVLAATIMFGLFFESLGDEMVGWLIFGFVAGALLSNGIIEVIYEFDLKSAIRGLKGLAIYGLVFAAGISVMLSDLTGYDTRLPKEGSVTAVSIQSSTISSMLYQTGPLVGRNPIAYQRTKDILDYYTFTDPVIIDSVVELAKTGMETAQDDDTPRDYTDWSYVIVTIHEGAGSYSRSYRVPAEAEREILAKVFTSDEFKQKLYAVFTMEASDIQSVHIRDNLRYNDLTGNYSSPAVKEELLEALRADILRMTPTTLRTETALFSVMLDTGTYDRTIPVYSGFISTLSVLEKYDIPVPAPLSADEIDSIVVNVEDEALYEKYGPSAATNIWPDVEYPAKYGEGSITITDKAEIARLLPMLIMVDDDRQNLGLLETVGDLYFSVYATDAAGGWVRSFRLLPEYASEVTVGMALSPAACAA